MEGTVKQIEWATEIKVEWVSQLDRVSDAYTGRAARDETMSDIASFAVTMIDNSKAAMDRMSAAKIIDQYKRCKSLGDMVERNIIAQFQAGKRA